jgi:predicted dehydrogenase
MAGQKVRIGIVGTGGKAFAHAGAFRKIKGVEIVGCCDVLKDKAAAFAEKWEIPRVYSHHKKMAAAAKKAGVANMINFSYRGSSGLQAAAKWVKQGGIGRILHVEASYLQGWLASCSFGDWKTNPAWTWRLSTRHGSQGTLGDIGCHIYDMASFLCGDIAQIHCRLTTFDKPVPRQRIGEYVLDANDSFVSSVVFKNGATGAIHSTRWATGQRNSLRVRAYGDQGAVEVDLDRAWDEYRVVKGKEDIRNGVWQSVKCRPTPSNHERFIRAIRTGKNDVSDFQNGLKVQAYLHYSFVSAKKDRTVKVAY